MSGRLLVVGPALFAAMAAVGAGCGSSPSSPTASQRPNVLAVVPNEGPTGGSSGFRIEGAGFQAGATVTFGDAKAVVTRGIWEAITVDLPPHPPGVVDVSVTNLDGSTAALRAGFTYKPLAITEMLRTRGLAGAQQVSIVGSGFAAGLKLELDGVAQQIKRLTPNTIDILLPFHEPGTVDMVATATNQSGETVSVRHPFTFEVVTLVASASQVKSGERLSVSWTAPDGRTGGDWITFSRVNDLTGHERWFPHTYGQPSGTFSLTAPDEPGDYEFLYLIDDVVFGRSRPVAVTGAGSP